MSMNIQQEIEMDRLRARVAELEAGMLDLANRVMPKMRARVADLEAKAQAVLSANDDFRQGMPKDWEGDPMQDACDALRAVIAQATDKPPPMEIAK